ncbi:gamma-glutamylcyclotransferase (GGCT)/AIG2-like uncharacterized protein YtfP [Roseospira visakhapatnamensis]|uniref:Gamma-glutamylcyclotransferase (GGCT)/AIG2-like uncharacterized protein YtfP n=1 Tax=Roseospira visakhapatnamensis TaxID=390880 RepID=A0A7W6WA89_9PROT|nr:gamma-glutamylcyclotransferase (GGCT)/AIG2-like uncharacterized protein YtfP [Roseospira visakhapatnamensis]
MLYLAYGSNLSRARMAARCPAARPLRPVTLPGWALRFERVATIVPDRDAHVRAALYRLTETCRRTLDRIEGVGEGRYRCALVSLPATEGVSAPVLTYIKVDDRRGPPTQDYLDHVVAGFQDWGFDLAPLRRAVAGAADTVR